MKFQGSYSQLLQVTIFINVIIYLAATRPTVGNLTHLMMITGLVLIQLEGHLEPHNDLINAKSKLLKQCCIQKRFRDKDSSWRSTFLNISKILLIYIILETFSQFFLAVSDVLLNRTQGSSLFTREIYQKTTIFFSFLLFLGTFLGSHLWTLPFSVRMRPCESHLWQTYEMNTCIAEIILSKTCTSLGS